VVMIAAYYEMVGSSISCYEWGLANMILCRQQGKARKYDASYVMMSSFLSDKATGQTAG